MRLSLPFLILTILTILTILPVPAGALPDLSAPQGGLIVHLGCGDGKETAALRKNERLAVHGLESDAALVEQAREHVRELGLYGPVSIERFTGESLPYVDNLINLVIAEDRGKVPQDEILRVLAPGGVAYVREGGDWKKLVKPQSVETDEWSHFLHDAGNNAVARDTVVGPPRGLRWVAPPLWLRSHEAPSGFQAQVSAGGRLFYIFDEGLVGITDERLPDRWSLVCRDAFNGKLLWKRPLDAWGWREWSRARYEGRDWTVLSGARTDVPAECQRRLVADSERLYATLGFRSPLSILDAATGGTLFSIDETDGTREILLSGGIVVVYRNEGPSDTERRRGTQDKGGSTVFGVEGKTGEVLWRHATGPVRPLFFAIDRDRVVLQAGNRLECHELRSGEPLWGVERRAGRESTLVATHGVVLISGASTIESRDLEDGRLLWRKEVSKTQGAESQDLFVVDDLVWHGMVSIDDSERPVGRSAHARVIGRDLRTGEEKRSVVARDLRSPEHHHRCYRNKATSRYLISALEGAEFLDLQSDRHSQNNWLRGACRLGVMPSNGLLYVPPDQCFCHPGSKILGYTAVTAESAAPSTGALAGLRTEKGKAFGSLPSAGGAVAADDWPTFRHDPRRSGSTPSQVPARLKMGWKAALGGRLTAPVAAGGRLFVASVDAHTLHVLNARDGKRLWSHTAGGRIDSPPTIHGDRVLLGSADGRVTCLRAADGELLWRFMAAPRDRRIAAFGQIESVWPVHGSVLVREGVAYITAGRSTYLDGGIRVIALDPSSGERLHSCTLEGPFPAGAGEREVSFYTQGANSDVLVSEGGFIYMRQKKLTPELEEVKTPVLSSKGAMDVGLHVFSTAGLLDGSWYNRTFWMYSRRWPGFQLASQAPKSGQLLVVDDERTYAVKVFHRRNRHSPMFFPGREGYLLYADSNTTEPQIVGEEGARDPVPWLPQSEYARPKGPRTLDSPAFGLDKMVGYTRAEPPLWMQWLPIRIRAMVKAGNVLFVAGPPDVLEPSDPYSAFEDRSGARLAAVSAAKGVTLSEMSLSSAPVFDGMAAARGRLFLSLRNGDVVCLRGADD